MGLVSSPPFSPHTAAPLDSLGQALAGVAEISASEERAPVTTPVTQSRPRFYRPELDLLRFGAFLMVWVDHALIAFHGYLPARLLNGAEGAGSCGVPIFFFLSAYLITELLRRERARTGSVHLGHFYLRRVLRIWPLYFGVLVLYALLGLRFHGFRIEPGRLLASFFLAGNWYIAQHPTIRTPMRALWSISVEEQWYLLSPLLLIHLRRRPLILLCGCTIAASCALLGLLARHSDQSELHVTAWLNSGVQFQYFALGAGTALLLNGRIPKWAVPSRALLGVIGIVSIVCASVVCQIRQGAVLHTAAALVSGYALAGAGALLCFLALLGVAADCCPSMLVRLGQISFGLYVFHELGFFLVDEAARKLAWSSAIPSLIGEKFCALAVTIGLALASYHLWELPFLRLKQRWTYIRTREAT